MACGEDSAPHHQQAAQERNDDSSCPHVTRFPVLPIPPPKHILNPLPSHHGHPTAQVQPPPPSWTTGSRDPFWNVSLNHDSCLTPFTAPMKQRTKSSPRPPSLLVDSTGPTPFTSVLLTLSTASPSPENRAHTLTRAFALVVPSTYQPQTSTHPTPSRLPGASLRHHRLRRPCLATCFNGNTPHQLCPLFESHFKSYLLTEGFS